MNKKALFWAVIGFLILIDAGLIFFQFVYKKPKADVNLKPNSVNIKQFDLLPQTNPNPTLLNISFADPEKIYTPDSNFFYSFPVLTKRQNDNLLFLARGKSSVKYDEIVYAKSFDLSDWSSLTSIKTFSDRKIVDLFITKNTNGYYLFYVTQDANNKYSTSYLYSANGTSWDEENITSNTDGLIKVAATTDKNSLRTIFLNSDKRTIEENFLLQNQKWTPLKTTIKLNLDIDDTDLITTTDLYYLLFSSNNVLYETHSLDFHIFSQPQAVLNLKDNNFYLSDLGVITLTGDGVFINKNQF